MKLYCVRHGRALSSIEDPIRPLSDAGRVDVNKIANYLVRHDCILDHVLYSSKERAKETAAIISSQLNCKNVVECYTLLCEQMDVMPIVDMIATWHSDTMLVGHMPFMPNLINFLLTGGDTMVVDSLPTASVVCLNRDDDGVWSFDWKISPDELSK